jgi:hypothetical protein
MKKIGCGTGQVEINGRCQKVSNITISARRWFDRQNTYHSVDVYANGKFVGREPFKYGYDDAYLQTAHEILERNGLFSYKRTKRNVPIKDKEGKIVYWTGQQHINKEESWHEFRRDMMDNRNKYVVIVSDVTRKKDL